MIGTGADKTVGAPEAGRKRRMSGILGIHHVTAICEDAQANVDFYAGLLGLRVLKVTVNFDDPSLYHLYYGDGRGARDR